MNRVKRGHGTLLEVIDRIPLYAAENEVPTGTPVVWEPTFLKLLHSVEGIFDGTLDTAKGGIYWADLRKIETEFFKEKILKNPDEHPRIVDMNSFSVFRQEENMTTKKNIGIKIPKRIKPRLPISKICSLGLILF